MDTDMPGPGCHSPSDKDIMVISNHGNKRTCNLHVKHMSRASKVEGNCV